MRVTARRLVAIVALALATFTAAHAADATHSTIHADPGGGHMTIITPGPPPA